MQGLRTPVCGHAEDYIISDERRTLIEHPLRERISLRGICRAVGVSLTWLLHFMIECFATCHDHLHVELPGEPTDVVVRQLEAEGDEMWSFVQKKAHKQWIWIAMDAKTRQIMHAYALAAHINKRVYPHLFRHQLMTVLTRKGLMSPKLQLRSGRVEERNLAIYRDLAPADVSAEYEQAMQSFPVRCRGILWRLIAASLPLPRIGIHRYPEPWLVRFLSHNAPQLIGFGVQLPNHHGCWTDWQLDVSGLRTGRKTLDHTVQEPGETDAHRPTDPA